MNTRTLIPGAMALLAAIGTYAAANPSEEAPRQAVTYADLNLGSQEGLARLYRRIGNAANQVCDYPPDLRRPTEVRDSKTCRALAVDRAVTQVNIPALHALHLAATARHARGSRLASNAQR
jgi:UrcA family protein